MAVGDRGVIIEVYTVEGDGMMIADVYRSHYEIADGTIPDVLREEDIRALKPVAIYRRTYNYYCGHYGQERIFAKRDRYEEKERCL